MSEAVSLAIETSCRQGGLALGIGAEIVESVRFEAHQRHAVQLIARTDELLGRHALKPADLRELYISGGPGGFTGLRVGITVARTLGQLLPDLRLVVVPTLLAVAENARPLDAPNLAVVMDAKEGSFYAGMFARGTDGYVLARPARLMTPEEFLAELPPPATVIGEALGFVPQIRAADIAIGDEDLWLPRPEGVWQVGTQLARQGQFIDFQLVRPIYLRQPEAIRLWEKLHPQP